MGEQRQVDSFCQEHHFTGLIVENINSEIELSTLLEVFSATDSIGLVDTADTAHLLRRTSA